ncbi:hypothetical protein [[Eubacterium] cellulosolvens]
MTVASAKEICRCNKKLKFLREYNRYFCNKCKTYPPVCPKCHRDLFWVPEYNRYYCNTCANYRDPAKPTTPSKPEKMVAPGPTAIPTQTKAEKYSPKEIENEFNKLKSSYRSGSIDKERFKENLQKMKFKDEHNRFWTIGAKTGRWYYHDGVRWNEAKPSQSLERCIFPSGMSENKNGAEARPSKPTSAFCISCGHPKKADKLYCTKCGAKQT